MLCRFHVVVLSMVPKLEPRILPLTVSNVCDVISAQVFDAALITQKLQTDVPRTSSLLVLLLGQCAQLQRTLFSETVPSHVEGLDRSRHSPWRWRGRQEPIPTDYPL